MKNGLFDKDRSCELHIFIKESFRTDQKMVPETCPTNLNWLKFVGQVPGTFTTNYLGP